MIGSERAGVTYTAVNVEGTRSIARMAIESGATPLVMFSGLGVAHYGQAPRTTNRYFLSKLEAEIEVYRSGVPAVVFRPSYIMGPGDGLSTALLRDLGQGVVEVPGDGRYRMQPIAVADAAEAALSAALDPPQPVGRSAHRVIDLVGPEPIAYGRFVERFADVARAFGHSADFVVRHIPVAEADRQAVAGGYRGMGPDELDCLLCDEVAEAGAALGPARTAAAAAGRSDRGRCGRHSASAVGFDQEAMRLGITEYIDCAHFLPGHPKCGQVHGHTYRVDITIEGDHNQGMVVDFNDLKQSTREVLARYDHRHWNDVLEFPSVENICELLSRELRARIAFPMVVRVWEGNGKWAEMYRPEPAGSLVAAIT